MVVQVKVDPLGEFRVKVLLGDTDRADSARLAGRSEFRGRERVESFGIDDLKIQHSVSRDAEKKKVE